MSESPLSQYFRKAVIHMKLPSGGRFYPENGLDLPPTGELPIFPMTALDEISYKTPDALFNGSAIVDVIKSCVPGIKDPWKIPSFDMNTILTSIRIASIGNELSIESVCPKCNNIAEFEVHLNNLIEQEKDISVYDIPLVIGDLKFFFRPLTYEETNANGQVQFTEGKIQNALRDESMDEETKLKLLSTALEGIMHQTIETITKSIIKIVGPDFEETNKEAITTFLKNCETDRFELIRDHVIKLRKAEELNPLHIKCPECNHDYEEQFSMDMTTFFVRNS